CPVVRVLVLQVREGIGGFSRNGGRQGDIVPCAVLAPEFQGVVQGADVEFVGEAHLNTVKVCSFLVQLMRRPITWNWSPASISELPQLSPAEMMLPKPKSETRLVDRRATVIEYS